MWAIISTWKMSFDGNKKGSFLLKEGQSGKAAIVEAIKVVESDPLISSVGYGALPNAEGKVQCDSAFMVGETLRFGAVGAVEDVKSTISLSSALTETPFNNFLVGNGAKKEAERLGLEFTTMETENSMLAYEERGAKQIENLESFNDHDTVGMVVLDQNGKMFSATSTSGLFMKKDGRVGDSPIIGSGLYVDDEIGGCAATGVGEEIMKGCLSYEVVRKMSDGFSPMAAAVMAVNELDAKLRRKNKRTNAMSVVCMNNEGEWGVGTNVPFAFVISTENMEPTMYYAENIDGEVYIREVEESDMVD